MFVEVVVTVVELFLFMVVAAATPIGAGLLCLRVWQRLLSTMASPVTDNRILYWPVVLTILWPLPFVLLWVFSVILALWLLVSPFVSIIALVLLYFFLMIGLGLAAMWIGSVIVACRLMVQWTAARHWRTVLSTLILPLTFSLMLLSSPFLWRETVSASNYARFFIGYRHYLAQVEKRPATEPRFVVWTSSFGYDDWGVLYDETDEVASDHPPESWTKKAEKYGVIRSGYRHIIGHFYFVAVTND